VALPAALALLTLLGLMTAGAVAAVSLSQRTTRLRQDDELLSTTADLAAATVIAFPDSFGLADLPFGVPRTFAIPTPQPRRVTATVSVTRLEEILWITASANLIGFEHGQRRVALIARFPSPGRVPPAALVTPGEVSLAQGVVVTADGAGDPDCRDTMLVAHPSDSASYYLNAQQHALLDSSPLVHHVRTDTTIADGSFSGILIVDGSVSITGTFIMDGLLAARGRVDVTGSIEVHGALMAFASGPSAIHVAGGFVRYSPCPIGHVFRTLRPPRSLRHRTWLELL
jgi:hypothetical protein